MAVTESPKYGTEIIVLHNKESRERVYTTGYLHLQRATVRVGERVTRGEKIGEVGLFWASDEIVHVHWRLWSNGKTIDPVSRVVGCFEPKRKYSTLELTFPLPC